MQNANYVLLLNDMACLFTGETTMNYVDYAICAYVVGGYPRFIDCGYDQRIHVWSTTVAVLEDRTECTQDEVLPVLRNVADSCKFHDPLSFKRWVTVKKVWLQFYPMSIRKRFKEIITKP